MSAEIHFASFDSALRVIWILCNQSLLLWVFWSERQIYFKSLARVLYRGPFLGKRLGAFAWITNNSLPCHSIAIKGLEA